MESLTTLVRRFYEEKVFKTKEVPTVDGFQAAFSEFHELHPAMQVSFEYTTRRIVVQTSDGLQYWVGSEKAVAAGARESSGDPYDAAVGMSRKRLRHTLPEDDAYDAPISVTGEKS